jgi:hypothetical protein
MIMAQLSPDFALTAILDSIEQEVARAPERARNRFSRAEPT